MRGLLLAAAAGALALTGVAAGAPLAAPAGAGTAPDTAPGTLVYVKDFDVYLSRADGTGERRLTTDGTADQPWVSPTGDDHGRIVAARGELVHTMDLAGNLLRSFDPPDIEDGPELEYGGEVVDAAISPDGARIAYTYASYHCELATCRTYWVTGVTDADGTTPVDHYGFVRGRNPSWVTGSRLIVDDEPKVGLRVFDVAGQAWDWFHDGEFPRYVGLADPVVSRDGRMLATTRTSDTGTHLVVYEVNGDIATGLQLPPAVTVCSFTPPMGQSHAAFAPDGSAVAWSQPDGVWIKSDPLDCSTLARRVVDLARDVSWSATELPADPGPQDPGPGTKDPGPSDPGPGQHSVTLTQTAAPRLVGKARVGRVLTVKGGAWSPAPSSVGYQWLRGGKAVKKATRASYRLTRKDRGRKISVRVTAGSPGLASTTWTSKPIRVKR